MPHGTSGSMHGMDPLRVYGYLATARTQLFDWIRPLTPEQYEQEHPIGLRSLARTLHHVKAAERSYMRRVRGRTEPLDPAAPEDDPDIGGGVPLPFDVLESGWLVQAAQTSADLAAVTDWDTPQIYTTTWEGRPYAYRASPADIFSQLAFHEVHHRAQALHMLRRLGVETTEVDYNVLMWTGASIRRERVQAHEAALRRRNQRGLRGARRTRHRAQRASYRADVRTRRGAARGGRAEDPNPIVDRRRTDRSECLAFVPGEPGAPPAQARRIESGAAVRERVCDRRPLRSARASKGAGPAVSYGAACEVGDKGLEPSTSRV